MKKSALIVLILIGILGSCNDETPTPSGVQFPESKVHDKLSDYNLFEEPLASLLPKEGVIPYDLNSPLFTDYASKLRFVYVPDGSITPYDTLDALKFPVGTILVKNFFYTLSNGNQHIVETRLLLHQSSGWNAEVYEWNEEQTEATRLIVGKQEEITFLKDGETVTIDYLVPNKNQCKNCHALGNSVSPIGPKVGNLNHDYEYNSGTNNQIDKWVSEGILESPTHSIIPSWPNYNEESADLNLKARAYLEANCAHCHRSEGAASNSGLYLSYYNTDSASYGFYKAPVAAGDGSGGLRYDIVPGNAEESILYYRMNSTDVDIRMPELGRSLIDEEGVTLIKDWINSM